MRSTYGPHEGADVVDWPLDYDELEPYYAEVERAIGVAGRQGANPFAAWRSGPYPMPPGPPMYGAVLSSAAAERVGLHPYEAPTAANSVAYDGRPACNNCGFCAFFGCPIHAKGDPVALLTKAMGTGRAELLAETYVSRILTDGRRATGVEYIDAEGNVHTDGRRNSSSWPEARSRRRGCSSAVRPGAPRPRASSHGALPNDRGRPLLEAAPASAEGARRDPRARRRHDPGRRLACRCCSCRTALAARWHGRAQRGRAAHHGGTPFPVGTSPCPGDARRQPARAHVGVHHAGRGPRLPDEHGRPQSLGARRPRLSGGAGHLPARPTRAGGFEAPRQDPAVGPRGDGGRVGAAHDLARRVLPRRGCHADPGEPARHGDGPHGRRPCDLGGRPLGPGARARQRRGCGLVGVPDVQRLRADPDPRRARGPRRAPSGGHEAGRVAVAHARDA